jgi:tetratricopeptide (TPR) repeat protein
MLVSRSQLCDATRGKLVIDMKKHRRSARPARHSRPAQAAASTPGLPVAYRRACHLAADGQHDEARRLYAELGASASDPRLQALITNDLATLDAVNGDFDAARRGLEEALAIDESCRPARLNLELLVNRLGLPRETACDVEAGPARAEPRPPTITGAETGATEAEAGPARSLALPKSRNRMQRQR